MGSRAEYFRERRKKQKTFSVQLEKEEFEELENKLKEDKKIKLLQKKNMKGV